MTELYELPSRPAARVGICRAAINDALSRGFTLKEIAARLDIRYKTFWQAWKEARIVVAEEKQLDLPVPVAPVQVVKTAQTKAVPVPVNTTQEPQATSTPVKRPLPGQQIPVGDGDAMNEVLAAKGAKWR